MTLYHANYSHLSCLIKCFNLFLFFKWKQSKSTPFPRMLGVGIINPRQKGAWEQSGLWTAEECLRTSLYHQCMDSVSKKLFPHYFISSGQAPAQLPASSTKAGWRTAMEGVKKTLKRISFSQDKQHKSIEVSILWTGFVLGGWNMTGMNTKGAQMQNCTMLFLHLPKTLVSPLSSCCINT